MSRQTVRYSALGIFSGPGGSTGFHFQTGFNDVYTGANSGQNLIQGLTRVQTVSHGFTVQQTPILQIGQLAYVDQQIITAPTVPVNVSWITADASNEQKIGLYPSGDQGFLTYILDGTQNNRNLFLAVAPEGQDITLYTGSSQVFQLTNCYFGSYSAEASVGGFATASATFNGVNFATSTGSIDQDLNAIDVSNGQIVAGKKYTLPVMPTGTPGSVAAIRYGDITMQLFGVQGLNTGDLKIQSYNLSFDTSLQDLLALGTTFSYTKVAQFPIQLSVNVTANYGDLVTGSLSNLVCTNPNVGLRINLYEPGCGSYGDLALYYLATGLKLQGQDFGSQEVSSNTATVNLSFVGAMGSPTDQRVNLFVSGKT